MNIVDGIRGMTGRALVAGLCVCSLACSDRLLHAVNPDGGVDVGFRDAGFGDVGNGVGGAAGEGSG